MLKTIAIPMKGILSACIISFSLIISLNGQRKYPPEITSDYTVVYKKVGESELRMWMFMPPGQNSDKNTPAAVFFFGGGWNSGSPSQFVPQCEYLASRGMVAAVADYRVASRHGVKANSCVSDAKSAVRWIREHADVLGVDPERIAAGGGSAGGHLAAATGTLPTLDDPSEDLSISSVPDAMLLFNPALVLAPTGKMDEERKERQERLKSRLGVPPEEISPYHHITKHTPPAIIFHGMSDETVPFETVEMFAKKMRENDNVCVLIGYKGQPHGFFNYGKNHNGAYISTLREMDQFLVELGWLSSPPEFVKK